MGAPPDPRAARLAAALRANLRRRKAPSIVEEAAPGRADAVEPSPDPRRPLGDGAGEG